MDGSSIQGTAAALRKCRNSAGSTSSLAAASGCRATYAEADRAFHRAVLALAGNEQLVQIAEDLHRRAQWPLVGGPVTRGRADLVADAAEHLALR